jgi:hypothetical protein
MNTVMAKAFFKKTTLFATAFVLAVSTLTAAVPFILSEQANAISGYSYTNVSLASGNWIPDRAAPSGFWNVDAANSRVVMAINQSKSASTEFEKTEGLQTTVPAGTTSLTGSFYVSPDWSTKSNLRVGLWGVTNTPASYPIIEYASNVDQMVGTYTGWRVWDTVNGGWTNVTAPISAGNYTAEVLLNKVQNKFYFYVNGNKVATLGANDAQSFTNIILNSYNKGTNVSTDNYVVEWKNLKAGTSPLTTACANPTTVYSNSVWTTGTSLDDTRSAGHNVITNDGIKVYTDNNSGQAKATGYRLTNYPLSANGTKTIAQSIDWVANFGSAPGLQLSVDLDNNGTADGFLVGEAIYGNTWWLSNGTNATFKDQSPHIGGGYGSQYYGTIDEWLTVFPSASVKAVGYSLGSGVYASGTLKSMTFGCDTYMFDGITPTTPTNLVWTNANGDVANNSFTNLQSGAAKWDASDADVTEYLYKSWNDISTSAYNSEAAAYQASTSTNNLPGSFNQGDGTYFFRVAAKDAAGNTSEFSAPVAVRYDSSAPTYSISNLEDGQVVATGATNKLTVRGSFNDVAGGSGANYLQLQLVRNGESRGITTVYGAVNNGVLGEFDVTGFESGTYTVNVLGAADGAGNWAASNESTSTTFTINNTAPVIVPVLPVTDNSNPVGGIPTTPIPLGDTTPDAGNTTTPTITNPAGFAAVLGNATGNTDNANNNAGVEGASTENKDTIAAANTEANKGTFLGLNWYWWILIIAALAAIAWWIAAAARKRQAE